MNKDFPEKQQYIKFFGHSRNQCILVLHVYISIISLTFKKFFENCISPYDIVPFATLLLRIASVFV